jgi:choline dehydrogenase-like flavoprotein
MVAPSPRASASVLADRERATLRALAETLVPSQVGPEDRPQLRQHGAVDRGVDAEIVRLWAEYFPVDQRAAFRQLLQVVDSRGWNLLLTGRPVRFTALSPAARERYLRSWALSPSAVKRRGFQSIKRLVTFLFYALPDAMGTNPVWPEIGYRPAPSVAPPAAAPPPSRRPAGLVAGDPEGPLSADVCVIGSGAGGSVVAAELARAGHSVLVVESGPYLDRSTFSGREAPAMEGMFQRHGLLTTRDLAFQLLAGETAGGSTTVNWMTCLRPSPLVRREWEAAGATGVAGPTFDAHLEAVWERLSVGRAESDVNPSNEVLRSGSARLGYVAGRDYEVIDRNALGCQSRCDFCTFGCPYDAKRSALVTYLADALGAGARLLCEARVDRVRIEAGRATGVEATLRSGASTRPLTVHARTVVVAAGAVQTPAILRRSGLTDAGVGRGLRLHPTTAIMGEFPDPVEMWKGPMQTIVVRRFVGSDADEHGPWLESVPAHPGLAALAVAWTGGAAHKAAMSRFARVAATIVLVRDVGEGRVGLDRAGETSLDYRLDPRDRANLVRGLLEAARIHRAAGARRIETLHAGGLSVGDGSGPIADPAFDAFLEQIRRAGVVENSIALFSAHPTGSARVGSDPRRSATGSTGEVHGVDGLWVADGSLFPTAPGVNPMISILAMARRTAEAIRLRLAV